MFTADFSSTQYHAIIIKLYNGSVDLDGWTIVNIHCNAHANQEMPFCTGVPELLNIENLMQEVIKH